MEAECASYCSSLDAICEESEMIGHLQSMFWSSSDADPNLCSCNSSLGLPSSSPFTVINNESYDTMALVNSSPNISFDHQVDALVSENEMNIGIKRKVQMDEQKGHDKEVCTALSAPRKTGTIVVQSSKSRASNQSAKDSQSRYAKKRRHMINERLRILQELIPNGTKVDISTMLQEAVQYVKFLHLQIKLLSSDEMWMYAPLAYNGINIGLLHLNSPAQERQE